MPQTICTGNFTPEIVMFYDKSCQAARAVMPNVIWFHRPEHNGNLRQGDELDAVIGQVSNCRVGPFITPLGSTNEQCACRYSSWHHPGGYVTKPADYTSRPTNYRIVIEGVPSLPNRSAPVEMALQCFFGYTKG